MDTFGKQWQDTATKAKTETVPDVADPTNSDIKLKSGLQTSFHDGTMLVKKSEIMKSYFLDIEKHIKNSREGVSANEARRYTQDSLWQLEKDSKNATIRTAGGKLSQGGLWDSDNAGTNKRAVSNRRRTKRVDVGGNIIGQGIVRDLVKQGRIDLRGRVVTNAEDVAALAQVYRNPKFETFRIIYTKGNEIVGHEGISSRLP